MSTVRPAGGVWTRGVSIGRLIGVPVTVTPSWLLSVAIIALMSGPVVADLVPSLSRPGAYLVAALLAVLLGVSVLAHELGHCVVAQRFGVGVVGIQLFLLGGVSEIARIPRTAREEAAVAAAGPVVSAALCGAFAAATAVTQPRTVWWLLVLEMAVANGILAIFNLLPALPLDGGRVLRAGLWRQFGDRRTGTRVAVLGGYLVAAALVGWSIFRFGSGDRASLVQGAIGLAMAGYIAVGARGEQREPEPLEFPEELQLAALARPVVELPAETPVELALTLAAGSEVLLLGAEGVVEAVLDLPAARSLAVRSPGAPAGAAGHRMGPHTVVLFSDTPSDFAQQLSSVASMYFLLIGQDGRPQGVLRRDDVTAARQRSGR